MSSLHGKFIVRSKNAEKVHMKFTQKTKYFIFGAIATAVLVPLGTYAVKTIPVTFAEGDVLSASVMNSLMTRINDVQQGFVGPTELAGAWTCTTKAVDAGCNVSGFSSTGYGIWTQKSQTVTFTCGNGSCSWTASTFFPGSCMNDFTVARQLTQSFDVSGNQIANKPPNQNNTYVHTYQKINPNEFVWNISGYDGNPNNAITNCIKSAVAPAPADALTATVSGTSVALTWTDQSTDESGFKIQYKTSAKGSWTTATTTAANATSYTLTGLTAGTYWIRIVAKNTIGDSMSSSEVQAVVPASYQICIANC